MLAQQPYSILLQLTRFFITQVEPLPTDAGPWVPIATTSPALNSSLGLLAKAFRNNTMNEIVISFRGTDNDPNVLEDLLLGTAGALSALNPILLVADEFAQAVAKANSNATITLSGHSLGGYLAQAAAPHWACGGSINSARRCCGQRNRLRKRVTKSIRNPRLRPADYERFELFQPAGDKAALN